MQRLQIKAQPRESTGKGVARKLRAQGRIPGIVYGTGLEPIPLSLDHHDFDKALQKTESTNILIDLELEGKETLPVMLREYQAGIIKRDFLHVDFQKIDLSKKIKVEIPVHLKGTSIGVKEGGVLEHTRRTLEVRCLPDQVPASIDVDISQLNIGDTIHFEDLKLPEGVEGIAATNFTVAAVVAPTAEVVEAPKEEAAAEPEVTGQKKAGEEAGKEAEKK